VARKNIYYLSLELLAAMRSSKDQLTPADSKNKLQATSCVMNVITKTKISLSLSLSL